MTIAGNQPGQDTATADWSRRVVVAGGGIAGLAAAWALHRQGVPVLVLESQVADLDTGLAINLPGNAVRALSGLGLADELSEMGALIRRREYRDERGRVLFSVDEADFWGEDAQPRCVRRSDLVGLLRRKLPDRSVRDGWRVTSVTPPADDNGGEPVTVSLADGASERCGFLVGADGVHSSVRDAVFGQHGSRAALLSEASWRFIAPNPGVDCWTVWAGRHDTLFLLIPVGQGEVYGWVSAPGRAETELQAAFAAFPRIVRDVLDAVWTQPSAAYYSPLEEVRLPTWSRGRVLLIGDAAHATAPVWAQGAALALEDAQVLAELLSTCGDWDQVGPEYERRRRPRVDHVTAATDRMSRLAALPGWFRNALLPLAGPRSYRAAYQPLRAPVLSSAASAAAS